MASSHDATSPCDLLQGLVTGTSPIVCADLNCLPYVVKLTNFLFAGTYTIEDGASADGSVSSGDEVLGTNDSSPAPSPKRLLANIQDLNKVMPE